MAFAMMLNDLGETDKAAKLNAAILAQVEEARSSLPTSAALRERRSLLRQSSADWQSKRCSNNKE